MKKFVVAGLVMALSLAPALAMAQTGGGTSGGSTSGSGTSGSPSGSSPSGTGKSTPSTTSPGTPRTGPSNTPGMPAPGGSSTNPSVERSTNKADCESAGGKWQAAQMKCQVGG